MGVCSYIFDINYYRHPSWDFPTRFPLASFVGFCVTGGDRCIILKFIVKHKISSENILLLICNTFSYVWFNFPFLSKNPIFSVPNGYPYITSANKIRHKYVRDVCQLSNPDIQVDFRRSWVIYQRKKKKIKMTIINESAK